MYKIRGFFQLFLFLIVLFGTSSVALAQVPENLASSRTAIVIAVPNQMQNGFSVRGNWKMTANEAHKSFRKIGIDGVVYIYKDDLTGGPEVTKAYNELLVSRQIKNIVLLEVTGEGYNLDYELRVFPLAAKIDLNYSSYRISSSSLDELMLLLGRQVLRQGIARTNFLIPDQPEFLDDLILYTGTRYENAPGRLKNLGLAVAKFDSVAIPEGIAEVERDKLIKRNQQITAANRQLDEIMKGYPFKYQLVSFTSVEDLYKQGYQYCLFSISSSGHPIKQMLNYPTSNSETVMISEMANKGQKSTLKRIPANANMTKYYIKQTIVMDVHVGKRWDADVTWQLALQNFIDNLKFDYNLE